MSKRTTLWLDDDTLAAAQALALQYECSTAEAIRRAVVRHREAVLGLPEARRQEQIRLLRRLFDLFEGHDAEEEVRRIKEQDEGFR